MAETPQVTRKRSQSAAWNFEAWVDVYGEKYYPNSEDAYILELYDFDNSGTLDDTKIAGYDELSAYKRATNTKKKREEFHQQFISWSDNVAAINQQILNRNKERYAAYISSIDFQSNTINSDSLIAQLIEANSITPGNDNQALLSLTSGQNYVDSFSDITKSQIENKGNGFGKLIIPAVALIALFLIMKK